METPLASPAPYLAPRERAAVEALATLYVATVAAAASATASFYLFFPEMGALAYDVLLRPRGRWASQPLRLIVTPVVTAVLGTLVTRHLPYGVPAIVLVVALCVGAIALLRSHIGPALSAGLLPLALEVKTWLYPAAIVLGLAALAGASVLWRRVLAGRRGIAPGPAVHEGPPARGWLVAFLGFVAAMGAVAQYTGLRFVLFPPLLVIAYEVFAHPAACAWTRRPLMLPAACFLTALGGLYLTRALGTGGLGAGVAMAWGLLVLRATRLHMPAAAATALIPVVLPAPTIAFPLSVLGGTAALVAAHVLHRRLGGEARATPGEARFAS